ncbi:hypothetical protein [Erythrobacter sp. R86502]|uniref:hypothetical protein n=1 Tax=Erythrobacter sp. R86502 TaxID=3093846 RepID=UPI0036D2B976
METRSKGMGQPKIIGDPITVNPNHIHDSDLADTPSREADGMTFLDLVYRVVKGLQNGADTISDDFRLAGVSTGAIAVSLSSNWTGMDRWPGERDQLVQGHPVSERLAKVAAKPDYPEPCPQTICDLSKVEGFYQNGSICFVDGMVVPAGSDQLKVLAFYRWRPLFLPTAAPRKIYTGITVYDRIMSTDFIQRQLWGFGVAEYLSYLEAILVKSPELFVALWLRRWDDVDRLTSATVISEQGTHYEAFEIQPLISLRGNERDSFLAPWAIMSELERVFEILRQMKSRRNITAPAVREHIASYCTIGDMMSDTSEVGLHAHGLLLSLRFIHHSMNALDQAYADTDILARLKRSVACSDALQPSFRRVECPDGKPPALLMNGVDAAHFAPVSLHQIGFRVKTSMATGSRHPTILYQNSERTKREMWLSIVILANICPPTAQTLTAKLVRKKPERRQEGERRKYKKIVRKECGWLRIYPTAMALGAGAYNADRRDAHALMTFVEREFPRDAKKIEDLLFSLPDAFKNLSMKIAASARDSAAQVGQPGWTRGAHFEAWLVPDAEVDFLNKCSNFIRYNKELDHVAQRYEDENSPFVKIFAKRPNSLRKGYLPLVHPVENVQQIFRQQFDLLQIPDVIPSHAAEQQADRKFAILREAARRLPAWSPINCDPGLAERIGTGPKGEAGECVKSQSLTFDQIAFARDWAWQRDWRFCGRI